jgi:uncharacterized membrane protein
VSNYQIAGTFPDQTQLAQALTQLRETGFDMKHVSVIAKDESREPDTIAGVEVKDTVGNRAKEGAATGVVAGGVAGGLTGLLVGIGALAIPGIGPVITAGALGTALASAAAGGAIGASVGGLTGTLVGLGIPQKTAEDYNTIVSHGGYLVFVEGSDEKVQQAGRVLQQYGLQNYNYLPAQTLQPANRI